MVRLWLAMAVVAAVAVCLYTLFLGFAAGSAVAAWVPPAAGRGASAATAPATSVPPAPKPAAESGVKAAATLPPPLSSASPAVQSGPGAAPRPLILPRTGPAGTWLDEALFRQALDQRLAAVRPRLDPATRAAWAGQIALRAVAWHLNPWLVFAVIDVESSFEPDMVGQAGEIGLMQVLPSTGRLVAKRALGIRGFAPDELFQPAWNIRIGTAYLGSLVQGFDGDVPMALAAYNAGDAVRAPTGYSWLVLGRLRRLGAAGPTSRGAAS